MTRGPGVAGGLAGAKIWTGSPAKVSEAEVVMVGQVPDTVGSIVGVPPLVVPPLELPELEAPPLPLDVLPELEEPDELENPEELLSPPEPLPLPPPFDDEYELELDPPDELAPLLWPPELPPLPPELSPVKMFDDGAAEPPQEAKRAKPKNPRTRCIACLLVAPCRMGAYNCCAVKRAKTARANQQARIKSMMYRQQKVAAAPGAAFRPCGIRASAH
jgi:hypothetical protein